MTEHQLQRIEALWVYIDEHYGDRAEPSFTQVPVWAEIEERLISGAGWSRDAAVLWAASPTGWLPERARPADLMLASPETLDGPLLRAVEAMALGPGT